MARRKSSSKSTKRRRSASQIALYVISLLIVLSMAIGFVISMLPTPVEQVPVFTSTPVIVTTATPTATAEPSATPGSDTEVPGTEATATPQADQ